VTRVIRLCRPSRPILKLGDTSGPGTESSEIYWDQLAVPKRSPPPIRAVAHSADAPEQVKTATSQLLRRTIPTSEYTIRENQARITDEISDSMILYIGTEQQGN
jgi:hypothetical protein